MYSGPENSLDLSHLSTILADLDQSDQEARRIVSELSEAQANWRPSKTGWRIAQCLDHLGRVNTVFATAIRQAIEKNQPAKKLPSRPIQPGWFSRLSIYIVEPPAKRKFNAPTEVVPLSRIAGRDALEAFLRSQEDARAALRAGAGFDLNRIRIRSPFSNFPRCQCWYRAADYRRAQPALFVAGRGFWSVPDSRRADGFKEPACSLGAGQFR